MKNFFKTIKNTIKLFAVFPVLMGNFNIPQFNLETIGIYPQKIEIKTATQTEKISTYAVNIKNSLPLVINEKNIQIVPGNSNFEREQAAALQAARFNVSRRDVIAREAPRLTADPGLAQKRALVKEAASAYGIGAYWRILEAVWQVETGKSWDRSVSSYAGARGPWQFMPGTWNKYKPNEDASIHSARNGAYAAAKLLAQAGLSSGNVDKALFAYNHSNSYVAKVKRIAESIFE